MMSKGRFVAAVLGLALLVGVVGEPTQAGWKDESGSLGGGAGDTLLVVAGGAAIGFGTWLVVHHHRAKNRQQATDKEDVSYLRVPRATVGTETSTLRLRAKLVPEKNAPRRLDPFGPSQGRPFWPTVAHQGIFYVRN
jgi:hypothetical protein